MYIDDHTRSSATRRQALFLQNIRGDAVKISVRWEVCSIETRVVRGDALRLDSLDIPRHHCGNAVEHGVVHPVLPSATTLGGHTLSWSVGGAVPILVFIVGARRVTRPRQFVRALPELEMSHAKRQQLHNRLSRTGLDQESYTPSSHRQGHRRYRESADRGAPDAIQASE